MGVLQRRVHTAAVLDGSDSGGGEKEHPLSEVLQAARDLGYKVVYEEEEAEDWDDILEDLDDPWMREPSADLALEGLVPSIGASESSVGGEQTTAASPYSAEAGFEEVSASDVRELQAECDAAVVLLDVRSSLEFDTRSIPGAMHVPLKELTREAALALAEGGVTVVVVGSGDHRSQQAAVRLKAVYGLPMVKHFTGGLPEWEQS